MAEAYYRPKKRYKVKYKNIAILLAVFLLIVLLISRGCSALFSKKDREEKPTPAASGDIQNQGPPEGGETNLTTDPTVQTSYIFTYVTQNTADIAGGSLALVNSKIDFKGSVNEEDLMVVRENKNSAYSVANYEVKLMPEAMDALNEMLLAFYNATGRDGVMVNTGYRSYERQKELYDEDLASTGLDYSAEVSQPGYSEYQTGLAMDFTVYEDGKYDRSKINKGDYEWLAENCYKYGFILRYPEGKESLTGHDSEPWHYRYVGKVHATIMHNLDYCLEEYISYIKNFTIRPGPFYSVNLDDGSQYIVYYVPQSAGETTSVYLPKIGTTNEIYPYEIDGNNVDGWVVSFLYKEGTGATPAPAPAPDAEPETTEAPDGENPEETNLEEEG